MGAGQFNLLGGAGELLSVVECFETVEQLKDWRLRVSLG